MSVELAEALIQDPERLERFVLGQAIDDDDYWATLEGLSTMGAVAIEPGTIGMYTPNLPPSMQTQRLIMATSWDTVTEITQNPDQFINNQATFIYGRQDSTFAIERGVAVEHYPNDDTTAGIVLMLDPDTDHYAVRNLMAEGYKTNLNYRDQVARKIAESTEKHFAHLAELVRSNDPEADLARTISEVARDVARFTLGFPESDDPDDDPMPTVDQIDEFNHNAFALGSGESEERQAAILGFMGQLSAVFEQFLEDYDPADPAQNHAGLAPAMARKMTEPGGILSLFSPDRITDQNRDQMELFAPLGILVMQLNAVYDTSGTVAKRGMHYVSRQPALVGKINAANSAGEMNRLNVLLTREMIRKFPGLTGMGRYANLGEGNTWQLTDDVTIGHRDRVWQLYPGANHTASKFPNPTAFDIDRPQNAAHVSFGANGPHDCLGRHQAKLFIEESLRAAKRHGLWPHIARAVLESAPGYNIPFVRSQLIPPR